LSEDQTYGEASVQADQGFTPMADAYAPPAPEPAKKYGQDADGLRAAAADLDDERRRKRGDSDSEPTPREYRQYGGSHDGEKVAANETISVERAVTDIQRQRNFEIAAAEQEITNVVAAAADGLRGEQPTQPQAQPETHAQPEPQEQQQPPVDVPPGVDRELYEELQRSPKLRAAIEQDVAKLAQAQQQYATAVQSAAEFAAAGVLSQFEELRGLRPDQIPTALSVLAKTQPQRAQAAMAQIAQAQQIATAAQQARAQEAQLTQERQAQAFKQFSDQQDKIFEESIKHEPPATVKAVRENLVDVLEKNYGISRDELRTLYQTQPILRSASVQRLLYDITATHLAKQGLSEKLARPVPPVQKPGVATDRSAYDHQHISNLSKRFEASGDIKDAANLILARRTARGR
jgi:hypothetical protein